MVNNFAKISVDGKKGERVITLQTFNISNEQKWQYQIKESELKIIAH